MFNGWLNLEKIRNEYIPFLNNSDMIYNNWGFSVATSDSFLPSSKSSNVSDIEVKNINNIDVLSFKVLYGAEDNLSYEQAYNKLMGLNKSLDKNLLVVDTQDLTMPIVGVRIFDSYVQFLFNNTFFI